MRLGLALGSGGARGWCHIGVLRVLEENGVHPGVVAGCSMGAVVGAAWAAGRLSALEAWCESLSPKDFWGRLDPGTGKGGLLAGSAVESLLEDIGVPETIEELDLPFAAVATDMQSGEEVWLREGSLADAIRASVAIPGLLAPHNVNGKWLLDGGMINPVPVSAARALGAEHVLSVNPNAKSGRALWEPEASQSFWHNLLPDTLMEILPGDENTQSAGSQSKSGAPNLIDVVSVSIDIMTDFARRVQEEDDPADTILDADLSSMSVLELHKSSLAIKEGRRIMAACVADLAAKVGPLKG